MTDKTVVFSDTRCMICRKAVSIPCLFVEGLNGLLWTILVYNSGFQLKSILYCILISILIVISIIDFQTYEIPQILNAMIGILGIIQTILEKSDWLEHVIGFFSISIFLGIIYYLSKGRAIGGGDVKFMAVTGLMLGWQLTILAFVIGCLFGSVIHFIRMKVSGAGNILAMGPYLSGGILCALLFGEQIIPWYGAMFGG